VIARSLALVAMGSSSLLAFIVPLFSLPPSELLTWQRNYERVGGHSTVESGSFKLAKRAAHGT